MTEHKVETTMVEVGGTTIVNLTPHSIVIELEEGKRLTIPPSGTVARVNVFPGAKLYPIGGVIPASIPPAYDDVVGLPNPRPGRIYIVSRMVAEVARRSDVFYPDTGEDAIRDEKGNIVAVKRLIRSV